MSAFVDLLFAASCCKNRFSGGGIIRTGSLDVSDDRSGLVVHELDANLGDTTSRSYCPVRAG